jgi:hypothetical protein
MGRAAIAIGPDMREPSSIDIPGVRGARLSRRADPVPARTR